MSFHRIEPRRARKAYLRKLGFRVYPTIQVKSRLISACLLSSISGRIFLPSLSLPATFRCRAARQFVCEVRPELRSWQLEGPETGVASSHASLELSRGDDVTFGLGALNASG